MLPYLPKGQQPGAEYDDKQRARMKARQSMGLNNISTKEKAIDRSKSKQNINSKDTGPTHAEKKKDSTANVSEPAVVSGSGETKEKDAEKKEAEAAEEETEKEVKKPRYFPPKKLPNPFENAAQEQEKFI